jgi:hypothetical protein
MKSAPLFAALVLTALPAAAPRADCASDIETVQARVKKEADPRVKAAVNKHLNTAFEQKERGDEIECHNAITRAWRALRTPPAAPKK